jgi:hypothetical protein
MINVAIIAGPEQLSRAKLVDYSRENATNTWPVFLRRTLVLSTPQSPHCPQSLLVPRTPDMRHGHDSTSLCGKFNPCGDTPAAHPHQS